MCSQGSSTRPWVTRWCSSVPESLGRADAHFLCLCERSRRQLRPAAPKPALSLGWVRAGSSLPLRPEAMWHVARDRERRATCLQDGNLPCSSTC